MSADLSAALSSTETWDIFCRVVDNYGDIGIAWRLARQLAGPTRAVRLFVDDRHALARIEPRFPRSTSIAGVDIHRWPDDDRVDDWSDAASVVVELLGCGLPAAYRDAMLRARPTPVWIDFEHLSAEPWVDDFHGLPSPQPVLPLTKHFFYPGFGDRTGGLMIETGIDDRRRSFVADAVAVAAFRRRLGLATDTLHAVLFAYPDAPVGGLLDAFARDDRAWTVAVPEGVLTKRIAAWFGASGAVGDTRTRGSLAVTIVPFVDQDDFDRLLWTSDVNFVRGEDSFVRAQLAARPFVWQPYRQANDAHRPKRAAFDARYQVDMDPQTRRTRQMLSDAWDDPDAGIATVAAAWLARRAELSDAAERWCSRLLAAEPLVDRLLRFVSARIPAQAGA